MHAFTLFLFVIFFNSAFGLPVLDSGFAKLKSMAKSDPERDMKNVLWTYRDYFVINDFVLRVPGQKRMQVEVATTPEEAKKLKEISEIIMEEDAKRKGAHSELKRKYEQVNAKVQELEEELVQKMVSEKRLLEERDELVWIVRSLERRWTKDDKTVIEEVKA
ncbi:hypothetical protein L596_010698 [Steinernema carpocapsae]|uniref:SXP/RAL-2 family protein Ani s 5-like cation-binding domain-containing protein n=1 Tax=Steinernema carpocapsae TaxID=34508 RepID=A0A4U5PJB0_STECR|nr:hypothetical protein L596_010698 [Steinernema carpocapsae]